jgi:hypothetical protein
MKQILFFASVLAILAFPALAAAADFSVSVTQPATIYAGNTSDFSAIITNSGADDWFSIAALGTYSSWIAVSQQNVFVTSGSSVSSPLSVTPVPDAYQNKYEYSLIVSRASNSAKVESDFFVDVLQSNSVIIKELSLSCSSCKPGEIATVTASIKNIGSRPLTNMKVVFSFGDRTKVMPVASLDFGTTKDFSTDFSIDQTAAPGQYSIDARIVQDMAVLAEKSAQFSVPSMPDIRTEKNVSSSIFGNYIALVSTNYGNDAQTSEIKSDVLNAWYSVYSGVNPSSSGPEYGWVVTLAPKESVTIAYSEIFWPAPIASVIFVFIGVYYYIVISSLSIRKQVMQRPSGKETSISLHVRSGLRPIDNAVVRDVVPKEFAMSGIFESIKPVVRKVPSGTELVWRLGRLKSREERILHYKIKSVSDFVSSRLHPAELNGKRGESLVTRLSNYVVLRGEPKEPSSRISVVVE